MPLTQSSTAEGGASWSAMARSVKSEVLDPESSKNSGEASPRPRHSDNSESGIVVRRMFYPPELLGCTLDILETFQDRLYQQRVLAEEIDQATGELRRMGR